MSDDQLSKLFRELPDEDPPETGMAALMAAARAKAAEMAPPKKSLWARFLDGLKAPPVLALATVVVLIGGAIIIKNHDATMDASNQPDLSAEGGAPMHEAQQPQVVAPTPPAVEAAKPEAAVVPATQPDPTPAPTPPPVVATQKPPVAHVAKPPPKKTGLADLDRDEPRDIGGGAAESVAQETPPPPPPPPPPSAPQYAQPPKQPSTAPPPAMTIASDDATSTTTGTVKANNAPPPGSLVEKLLHACQAAAQKRDCPTAKTLAAQIHDKDVDFYRARVLKDVDIVKCL